MKYELPNNMLHRKASRVEYSGRITVHFTFRKGLEKGAYFRRKM